MSYITIVIHGDFTGIKGSCITNVIKSKTTEVNYNLNSGDLEYFTFFIF